jgi:hypothetical protein
MYYNWPGTVRVPAPCQYAHKLAYQVLLGWTGISVHIDFSGRRAYPQGAKREAERQALLPVIRRYCSFLGYRLQFHVPVYNFPHLQ